jgi:RNA recognition motif-containing protein
VQILIRNIDRKLAQPEIVCLFRKFGRVSSCEIVKDAKTGLSKGFGFAEMPNFDEAMNAIEGMNGKKVGDSVLRVKRAAASTVAKKQARD